MSKSKNWNSWIILATKSTKIIKLFKVLKFAKPMITVLSIVVSAFAYSLVYNPVIGIGLVLLLLIHEMGHVIAMNREGFKVSGPVFIPFVGAALFCPKGMNRGQEARVGIGGPVVGSIGALMLVVLWYFMRTPWMLLMAYIGLFLNLFNMIPLSPLDGGRITQAIGKGFQIVGLILLMLFSLMVHQPGILLIWVLVLFDIRFMKPRLKLFLATLAEVSMVFMLTFNIGVQQGTFWIVFTDCVIGGVFLSIMYGVWANRLSAKEMYISVEMERNASIAGMNVDPFGEEEFRTDLSYGEKKKWFLSWLGLTLGLITIMIILSPYLSSINDRHTDAEKNHPQVNSHGRVRLDA